MSQEEALAICLRWPRDGLFVFSVSVVTVTVRSSIELLCDVAAVIVS